MKVLEFGSIVLLDLLLCLWIQMDENRGISKKIVPKLLIMLEGNKPDM
jgi:hypothetical protein